MKNGTGGGNDTAGGTLTQPVLGFLVDKNPSGRHFVREHCLYKAVQRCGQGNSGNPVKYIRHLKWNLTDDEGFTDPNMTLCWMQEYMLLFWYVGCHPLVHDAGGGGPELGHFYAEGVEHRVHKLLRACGPEKETL